MSNIKKWCEAILQVDTDKMSITSVRNIQLIKQEFERLQEENEQLKSQTPSPTGDRDRETHIQGIEKTLKENEKRINELKKGLEELSNIPLGTWIKDVRAKAKQLLNKTLSWDKK